MEFRVIKGFPNYEISETGEVYSTRNGRRRKIKPYVDVKNRGAGRGYVRIGLYHNGKSKTHFVHRLVLESFVGPAPTPEHQCAHTDGCPTNNHYTNLRWVTPKENYADKLRHGRDLNGERNGRVILTPDQVREIRKDTRRTYLIAKDYGVGWNTIKDIKKGLRWKTIA